MTPFRLRVTFLSTIAFAAAFGARAEDAANRPPNLIFILVDDLGYGDVGCYGQKTLRTPHVDRLAREGMRFTDFYSGSTVCAPARCVLMTGLHTGHAYIRGNGKDNLRPSDVTVAEVLRDAGYRTGLAGKWGLGHEGSTGTPTRQGFDVFFGYLDQHHAHNYYPTFLVRNEERVFLPNEVPQEGTWGQGVASKKVAYSHDLIAEEALRFIRDNQERPFFLYLAMTLPHANNEAGRKGMEVPDYGPYARESWSDIEKGFAGMVHRMDRDVGRVIDLVDELGLANDTAIFFTSDNGPHAEGGHDPDEFDSNGPLRGTKRDLFEGGIRVPFIARWPGHIAPGAVTSRVAGFQDVLPTLAELANAAERAPRVDGRSFAATLLGQDDSHEPAFLYWAFYERGGGEAVRMGPWKAIVQPIGSPLRLYDLRVDLGEMDDVAEQHPELARRARALMDASFEPSEHWRFPRRN